MSETPGSTQDGKPHGKAQVFFQTGNDAAFKKNFPYAIEMYRAALKLEPENLLFRQALRGVERQKFNNDPAKVGMLVGARNQPIRLRARSARSKGKHLDAMEHCEDAFVNNPWDVSAAQEAAEAAEQLAWPILARWLLESVAAQAGEDIGYIRHLARVYELNKEWDKAIHCWERVRKLSPADEEASRKVRGLDAEATITRAGLGEAIHRSETNEAEEAREALESELNDLKRQAQTPEERLRSEIEKEPDRVGGYLELADLLRRSNRLDEAEKVLARGVQATRGEELLLEAHADVQVARLRRAIGSWTRKAREQPDDTSIPAKLEQLTRTLADYELKEYTRRAERRPDDLAGRFQLGVRLAAAGRNDEAIAEFQRARADAGLKVQALYQAGICFEAKGLPKLAERNYQEALKAADPADQALLNALHYRLGRAAEAHGDLRVAEEHYNEVAANDFTYEDVAQRLESLNRRLSS